MSKSDEPRGLRSGLITSGWNFLMKIMNVFLMVLQQSAERNFFLPKWEKIRRMLRKRKEYLRKIYSLCHI
jgi:ABC-type uncharacterized transport system permease subunit